jgi:tetratricopeptide (TPR) repeat protein
MNELSKIAALALSLALLPGTAGRADDAVSTDEDECSQKDRAYAAMRACSRLLSSADIDPAKKVSVYEKRARAALVLFYFDEAADDFSHVLAANPDNISALSGRGEALSEDGQYSKAADDWAHVAALNPADLAALLQLGKNHHAAANYEKAIAAYEAALKVDKDSTPALVGLARALDMANQTQRADEKIADALKINPQNATVLLARGEMAERRGDTALAVESYKLSIKANGMQIKPRQALQRLGVETPP